MIKPRLWAGRQVTDMPHSDVQPSWVRWSLHPAVVMVYAPPLPLQHIWMEWCCVARCALPCLSWTGVCVCVCLRHAGPRAQPHLARDIRLLSLCLSLSLYSRRERSRCPWFFGEELELWLLFILRRCVTGSRDCGAFSPGNGGGGEVLL